MVRNGIEWSGLRGLPSAIISRFSGLLDRTDKSHRRLDFALNLALVRSLFLFWFLFVCVGEVKKKGQKKRPTDWKKNGNDYNISLSLFLIILDWFVSIIRILFGFFGGKRTCGSVSLFNLFSLIFTKYLSLANKQVSLNL